MQACLQQEQADKRLLNALSTLQQCRAAVQWQKFSAYES